MQQDFEVKRPTRHLLPIAENSPSSIGEYEIAKFFLGGDISVRLVATAPITKFTQKTIDKLIKHLQLDKEELPKDDIKSDDEQQPS